MHRATLNKTLRVLLTNHVFLLLMENIYIYSMCKLCNSAYHVKSMPHKKCQATELLGVLDTLPLIVKNIFIDP